MSGVNRLVSELLRAANTVDRLTASKVARMLDDSVEAVQQLRRAANIVPITARDRLAYVRTVAGAADKLSSEEWSYALLSAAEMIRDLTVLIDSGTLISVYTQEG